MANESTPYYFYLEGGVRKGPVTTEQLRAVATPEMLVWREGLADWVRMSDLPELRLEGATASAAGTSASAPTAPSVSPPMIDLSRPPKPNNYLPWLILITLLCSPVFGVVGIVFGITCNQCYAEGDYKGAERASRVAHNFLIVGVIFAVVRILLAIIFWTAFSGVLMTLMEAMNEAGYY